MVRSPSGSVVAALLALGVAGGAIAVPRDAQSAAPVTSVSHNRRVVDGLGGDRPVADLVASIRTASRAASATADPWRPLASPDVGEQCAAGLGAADLARFFAAPIGALGGADYQRAIRLPDDRVLWTFQDGIVDGTLRHNVGVVQSGRCFTVLDRGLDRGFDHGSDGGRGSWLLADRTRRMSRWHWILGGDVSDGGRTVTLFVVQMDETGPSYLSRPRPTALHRVVLDARSLEVVEVVPEALDDDRLYGWSVTSDRDHSYLYAHCYQQFGHDTILGVGECSVDVTVARVPVGRFDAPREYWDGAGWSSDRDDAVPVVDGSFVGSGNNPAQIAFDGERFVLVEKRDDWWGRTVEFGVADRPEGPFAHVATVDEPLGCDRADCNTYFASWVPWRDHDGSLIWSIGRNRWDGSETAIHLVDYRPTVATVRLCSASPRSDGLRSGCEPVGASSAS